jgi:hypothetical protein
MHDTPRHFHIGAPRGAQNDPNVTPRTPQAKAKWSPSRAETIAGTTSRHSSPRRWRRALERAIAANLVPGANATTLTVADDLTARMDYGTGHVRYRLQETMSRTGLGRSTVTKHVALLRSAGWLAWSEHGSLRNALRALGRPGYAPTAAVYAATIPPVFDEWAGNRLSGTGYRARVVGATEQGRAQQVTEAVDNSAKKAQITEAANGPWTPSLRGVKEEGQVQVEGGFVTTARARQRKTSTILGQAITQDAVVAAKRIANWVRPLVNWLQKSTRRQLSWVLLDLVLRGWDEQRTLNWLRERTPLGTWRPRAPHRHIAAALLAEQADAQRIADQDAENARQSSPTANVELQAYFTQVRDAEAKEQTAMAAIDAVAGEESTTYTEEQRRKHRGWARDERFGGLRMVLDHIADFGPDDALDLYGTNLCRLAERMDAIGALV